MAGRKDAKTAQSQDSEYDESADSDFNVSGSESGDSGNSSGGDAENEGQQEDVSRANKRQKFINQGQKDGGGVEEFDSGDEATLKEGRKAARRRQRQHKKEAGAAQDQDDSGAEGEGEETGGWRAKTRSMREKEEEARKKSTIASITGSTVDVDALWEKLNGPDAFRLLETDKQKQQQGPSQDGSQLAGATKAKSGSLARTDKANGGAEEEMISITRTYQFAGEQHTETKMVAKSSAEGRLWLQQQEAAAKSAKPWQHTVDGESRMIVRPARKISRFDPNISNIEAFRGQWATSTAAKRGARLNVVEKSKLDWASHVDAEGLKEELDVAAKAKDSYLHRSDFLRDVEMRKEDEAREARMRARH
ncbi:hypothetical protein DV736_g719, partial [Chaetothyriales sp. CBS 134916]